MCVEEKARTAPHSTPPDCCTTDSSDPMLSSVIVTLRGVPGSPFPV